jgi:hypothetical protein
MTEVNEESTVECAVCSTDTSVEDILTTVYNEKVCNDCYRTCERCDDIHSENDDMGVVDGDCLWCQSCMDNYANWCDGHEGHITDSTARLADRREHWCSDCLDNAQYCDECDNYYADGCDEGHNDEPDDRIVHDYNYKPDPIFHGGGNGERLFLGIEIEVEAGRNLEAASNYAHRLEDMNIAYLKGDGSLNCGFEVVSHPISHAYWKNNMQEFFDTMEVLRTSNEFPVKSWSTGTCGIHIHVSRAGFGKANGEGKGTHMHRFLNLIYSNQDLYEALAGRNSDRWASFHDIEKTPNVYDENGNWSEGKMQRSFDEKINRSGRSERYSAVNTKNPHTFEIRIFRGSTNGSVIKAHLDLAHASVEYTRVMTVSEVRDGSLSPSNFIAYVMENKILYPDLVSRLAKVWQPSVRLTEQNVSI